ncbi:MAG: type II toxin-antitoxin system PemK/MazF family toxin [Thermodesulfovibrionales bacterium]
MGIKKRPAVIISSNAYNSISQDVIIMAVTSNIDKNVGIGECFITDWQSAGLLKPSAVKPAVSTIEKSLVIRKLGTLSYNDRLAMENVLRELLGLNGMG